MPSLLAENARRRCAQPITLALLACLPPSVVAAQAPTLEMIEAYERRIDAQQRQIDAMRRELEILKQQLDRPPTGNAQALAETPTTTHSTAGDERPPAPSSQDDKPTLRLSGRIHRLLMQVDDGASTNGFFMDSDQGPTMLRADVSSAPSHGWAVVGTIEIGVQSNRAFRVSQDNPNPGTDIEVREANISAAHDRFGRLSFGRGFAAAYAVPELDLSGTVPAALLSAGTLAPGMKFVDNSTGQLSAIRVSDHFVDTERLLLTDRFRYDSPRFAEGWQVSGTLAADNRWDAALRYSPRVAGWSVRAIATYQNKPFRDIDHRFDVGASARHSATGLSLTAAVLHTEARNGRQGSGFVIKGGWLTSLNTLGDTAFSIDYTSGSDGLIEGDETESFGLFALQKWNAVGLDFYGGLRRYEVRRPDFSLKPVDVAVLGALYSF